MNDLELVDNLKRLLTQARANLCDMLLHLGEIDARRLHLPAAYPSLYEYCVRELHFSEGEAFGRIRAARVARRFPWVLAMLGDGRLHLTAVVLLARHLTADNARELIESAMHRSKAEILHLLAQRFPQPDLPTRVVPLASPRPASGPTPEQVAQPTDPDGQLMPASVEFIGVSAGTADPAPGQSAAPLAPERFALHCTLHEQEMADLRRAQELLGRSIPSGDAARVIGRALRLLVEQLEKPLRGAAASEDAPATDKRHVPAETKRQVWQRDAGQCTYVSDCGKRCDSHRDLELDHIQPFARGGRTSLENLRLRCRAHNQYEAERVYGAGFMASKRAAQSSPKKPSAVPEPVKARAHVDELMPFLMRLGFKKSQARDIAEFCADMPHASLEDRLRAVLREHGRLKFGRRTTSEPVAAT